MYDRFDAAARRFLGKSAAEIPWTTKVERPGVMELIEVADVIAQLDALMAAGAPRTPTGRFGDNASTSEDRNPT